MPNFHRDATMEMAADGDNDEYELDEDPFEDEIDVDNSEMEENQYAGPFIPGGSYTPEMLNWMSPRKHQPSERPKAEKPNKYFERANHSDIVELALVCSS